ncbi:hypothetical protein GIB67_009736 [Kingdonia uniflora]|uniref:EF-hand domain-containing protein n=1 Tax=Kingdonia uniflora TaxID=39325 RepID=A0A7J7LBF6_9MAGN|nr:hypothetical protein GIB67_009736 [Kingdonia uniflora]
MHCFVGKESKDPSLCYLTLSSGGLVAYSESQVDHSALAADLSPRDVKMKRVIVLGTGWAGMSFLKNIDISSFDVQVVSPRNYFAFTPLLPSVTCGTVEARSIVEPIRNIIRRKMVKFNFVRQSVSRLMQQTRKLCHSNDDTVSGKTEILLDYDYLVIATGAQVNTFNTPGVTEHCHSLKEVEDVQKIRRSVISCFKKADLPNLSKEEKIMKLHFVIVGGGPTGVEFAAELHNFVKEHLVKIYPMVQNLVRITVVQSGDHILNMFDEKASVSEKEIVVKVKSEGIVSTISYGMVVWSPCTGTRPVIRNFMEKIRQGKRRSLATDEWLRVEGYDSVYALGDCATIHQCKVMEDISTIFSAANKDNSGTLTVKEFQDVIKDILLRSSI